MPMYEYACAECGQQFEKLVKSMNDPAPIECPACRSTQTERTLSAFAVGGGEGGKTAPLPVGGCGRCGGPGPCAMG